MSRGAQEVGDALAVLPPLPVLGLHVDDEEAAFGVQMPDRDAPDFGGGGVGVELHDEEPAREHAAFKGHPARAQGAAAGDGQVAHSAQAHFVAEASRGDGDGGVKAGGVVMELLPLAVVVDG